MNNVMDDIAYIEGEIQETEVKQRNAGIKEYAMQCMPVNYCTASTWSVMIMLLIIKFVFAGYSCISSVSY